MPRQNRVTPLGEIVAVPERSTFMGNRAILHDAEGRIRRAWQLKRWIVCVLEFRGRKRTLMTPGHYTALFFLDEATALAAGHRPCAECRHARFRASPDAQHAVLRARVVPIGRFHLISPALLLAQGLSRDAVVQRIIASARPMACGPGCHGLLDAAAAVGATATPAPAVAGSRVAPATSPRPPASPSTQAPAPPSTSAAPTTAAPLPEPSFTDGGEEAAGLGGGGLGAGAAATAGNGVGQNPAAGWTGMALLAAAGVGLTLRAHDRTLTDSEADALCNAVKDRLKAALGADIRA